MKITDIQVLPLHLPMKPTTPIAVGGETSSAHTLLRIKTSEGIEGYGETFRLAPGAIKALIETELKPILIGTDPRRIELIWEQMYTRSFRYGRAGMVLHAMSGIEVALWDILGKVCGQPVYQLLGGACRESVPAYASLHRYARPAEVAEMAMRFVDRGYKAVKLHQSDVASVAAVREAVGADIEIMLDASGAWTPRQALDVAKALEPYRLQWLEEPLQRMDDYDGLRWLRDHSPVPIAAGENEYTHWGFREIVSRRAVDIVQPDVIKSGGISSCRKIFALAEAFDLEIAPHCFYYGPGIAATLHLAMASTRARYVEINAIDLEAWFMVPPMRPQEGQLTINNKPGLGIEFDTAVLDRYAKTI